MAAIHREEFNQAVHGGAVAGIVGGVVLQLYFLLAAEVQRTDVWRAVKGPSAAFFGHRAAQSGFDALAVLVGIATHFAVASVWGILFGVVAFGLSRSATLIAGVGWGFTVWIGMFHVILPLVGLQNVASGTPIGLALLEHVIFGLSVAIGFFPYQREIPTASVRARRPSIP
jgi:hypothetical protein